VLGDELLQKCDLLATDGLTAVSPLLRHNRSMPEFFAERKPFFN